jgi:hypothetical protein
VPGWTTPLENLRSAASCCWSRRQTPRRSGLPIRMFRAGDRLHDGHQYLHVPSGSVTRMNRQGRHTTHPQALRLGSPVNHGRPPRSASSNRARLGFISPQPPGRPRSRRRQRRPRWFNECTTPTVTSPISDPSTSICGESSTSAPRQPSVERRSATIRRSSSRFCGRAVAQHAHLAEPGGRAASLAADPRAVGLLRQLRDLELPPEPPRRVRGLPDPDDVVSAPGDPWGDGRVVSRR